MTISSAATAPIDAGRLSDRDWSIVVLWFVALNILDLGMTLHLVARGAQEMNPIMAALLDAGWEWAAVFKGIVTAAIATGLWLGRRHQLVQRVGVAFVVLFAALAIYQFIDVWAA